MSLKAFHLFFITLSVILAAFVAAWAVEQFRVGSEPRYLVASAASLGAGAGLAVYATRFRRKMKGL